MSKYILQTAANCLDIVWMLGSPEYNVLHESDIANELGLSRDQAFRCLKTLQDKKIVTPKDTSKWGLSPEIVRLADGLRRYISKRRSELDSLEREFF